MQTFKKLTPLIVLSLFLIAGYFIMQGMDNAVAMTQVQVKE